MKQLRKQIRWKIVFVLFGLSMGITLLLSAQQVYTHKQILQEAFEQQHALLRDNLVIRAKGYVESLGNQFENELATYNFSRIIDTLMQETAHSSEIELAYIVDTKGNIIVHTAGKSSVDNAQLLTKQSTSAIETEEMLYDGRRMLRVSRALKLGLESWGVLTLYFSLDGLDTQVAAYADLMHGKVKNAVLQAFATMAVFLVLTLPLVYTMAVRMSEPITRLTQRAEMLARGEFDNLSAFAQRRDDEIGLLSEAFDRMNENLLRSYRQLETYNTQLEKMVHERTLELEQKNIELLKHSRLVMMGEMIEQIAHQWRQPLNTMALIMQDLYVVFTLKGYDPERFEKAHDTMNEHLQYMSKTIDDFRNFYSQDKQVEAVSVESVIKNALALNDASLRYSHIAWALHGTGEHFVRGLKNEMVQIFMNLIQNARDAMVDRHVENGRIDISVIRKGTMVEISVEDNGGGIPEEAISRIFDPYFSTKGEDKGTGIGLYMSKNIIVQNMQGSITVENTGIGARFIILLAEAHGDSPDNAGSATVS